MHVLKSMKKIQTIPMMKKKLKHCFLDEITLQVRWMMK